MNKTPTKTKVFFALQFISVMALYFASYFTQDKIYIVLTFLFSTFFVVNLLMESTQEKIDIIDYTKEVLEEEEKYIKKLENVYVQKIIIREALISEQDKKIKTLEDTVAAQTETIKEQNKLIKTYKEGQ